MDDEQAANLSQVLSSVGTLSSYPEAIFNTP